MNSDNFLLTVAVIAVIISIVGISITYNSVNSFENALTGFASYEYGYVNITVTSLTLINITEAGGVASTKTIDWGAATVNSTESYAVLVTNGTVQWGTWNSVPKGFVIENIGNKNVTLSVYAGLINSSFLGGSDPEFKYNLTDEAGYEGSCNTWLAGHEAVYHSFEGTSQKQQCSDFGVVGDDRLRLDIYLKVPANSYTGARNTSIILEYSAI